MLRKFLLILFLLPLPLHAESVKFDSLPEMEAYAVQNNPALIAKRSEVLAARELRQIRGGFGDAMLGIETMENSFTRTFVSQTLPFFGKISTLEEAADFESQREKAAYHILENQTRLELRSAYYEWVVARQSIAIYEETLLLLKQLVSIADSRYSVGQDSQTSGLRLRTDLYHWQALLVEAQTSVKYWKNQIRRALGLALHTEIDHEPQFPEKLPDKPEFQGLLTRLQEQNPELQETWAIYKRTEKEREYLEKIYGPDLTLEYSRYQNNMPPDQNSFQFQINVPWFNARNDAQVRQARQMQEAAHQNYQGTRLKQTLLLRQGWDELEKNKQFYHIHREALPFAKQTLDTAMRLYRSSTDGKSSVSYMEVMDAYRTLLETKLDLIRHERDYWLSLAKIQSLFSEKEEMQ